MKYKLVVVSVFLFAIASNSFCQSNFRNGYIITMENDTIYGQVDYRSNAMNYNSCIFKTEQEVREYYPGDIYGFGYENDKFFVSQIVEGSFVEGLVLGSISLYKSKQAYYLKKDTSIYVLESLFEEIEIDGKKFIRENNNWRGIIAFLISDCIHNPSSAVSGLNLDEKSLGKLVVRYNECKNADYKEFKVSKPWVKYEFGGTVGLAATRIRMSDQTGPLSYFPDSYSSIDPSVGILLGISSPRISENFAFQGEIHFIKSSYSSLVVRDYTVIIYNETYIDLSTLSIPLSLKYTFPWKNNCLYVQSGVNLDLHLNASSRLLTEVVNGSTVYTWPESTAMEINNHQVGFWGGLGIMKSYQKFNASIAIRYFTMSRLGESVDYTANSSRILVNLILYK